MSKIASDSRFIDGEDLMIEEQQPNDSSAALCRWRRTERRTRAAKEIEMEIRLRERQRARRFADRGDRDRLRWLPPLPLAAPGDNPSYR